MKANRVNNREFELNYFPAINLMDKHVSKYPRIDKFRGKVERRLNPDVQLKMGIMTEINAEKFIKPPRFIDGSFERTVFLAKYNSLKSFLMFPRDYTKWFEQNNPSITNGFTVAVHVRRTDYLNLGHIYDVVNKAYYLNAVDAIRQSNGNVTLHLFSDDPASAIRWLGNSIAFDKVISQPTNIPNGEVLRLLSTYDGIIAANSTFSWWAAFLGKMNNSRLQIVLPKKYSNLNEDNPIKYLKIDGAIFL